MADLNCVVPAFTSDVTLPAPEEQASDDECNGDIEARSPSTKCPLSPTPEVQEQPEVVLEPKEQQLISLHNVEEEDEEDRELSPKEMEAVGVGVVLDSYFSHCGPSSQTINSFNHLMEHSLPDIFRKCGRLCEEEALPNGGRKLHMVKIRKVMMEETILRCELNGEIHRLYPQEARLRNLNYSGIVYAQIEHSISSEEYAGKSVLLARGVDVIKMAEIPVMVKSKFCTLHGLSEEQLMSMSEDPTDSGGYFIINGKERVLISQERPATNRFFIFKPMSDADYKLEAEIRSSPDPNTDEVSALWIRIPGQPTRNNGTSPSEFNPELNIDKKSGNLTDLKHLRAKKSSTIRKKYIKKFPGLVVYHTSLQRSFPLLILFKALGCTDHKSVWESFGIEDKDCVDFFDILTSTLSEPEALKIKTQEDAYIYIGKVGRLSYWELKEDKETGKRQHLNEDQYLAKGKVFVDELVLPHLGIGNERDQEYRAKSIHIGYMVNGLISAYLGRIPCDDRDHLENKRFEMAGPLMANLLKKLVNSYFSEMGFLIRKRIENKHRYDFFKDIARSNSITSGLIYSFSTGNWGDRRKTSMIRQGVCQPLNRLTQLASQSFLRRINSPVNRLVRMVAPRMVHNSGFGYLCPADTPEGEPVGLLKNLSIMAHVSVECDLGPVHDLLKEQDFTPETDFAALHRDTKIMMNSTLVGSYPRLKDKNPQLLVDLLKKRREEWDEVQHELQKVKIKKEAIKMRTMEKQKGLIKGSLPTTKTDDCVDTDDGQYKGIPSEISISYDFQRREIRIRSDAGRPLRPLFKVQNHMVKLKWGHVKRLQDKDDPYKWQDLLKDGVIEFVDPSEEEDALIAMFPDDLNKRYGCEGTKQGYLNSYTHLEIHPSSILGVCASLIPFANHNQSPRNTYQSNMAKQSLGIYALNYKYRYDSEAHVLYYPQRPVISTWGTKFTGYDECPAGINAIVAIQTCGGYNQEDSVVMNVSAIERGLFRSLHFRSKTNEAKIGKGCGDQDETFEVPVPKDVSVTRFRSYDHLDEDGLPNVGMKIEDGQALIAKTQNVSLQVRREQEMLGRLCPNKRDMSEQFKCSQAASQAYVDSVILTDNAEGYRHVKVRVRSTRIPQIGDKFASRHGQKGVMGMSNHETDLPFTKDGITPDIIINPHAIPSRMTIGHLIETICAKISTLNGRAVPMITDGTCFNRRLSVQDLQKELRKLGFNQMGMEAMYLGTTGRKINAHIFIGPCYYQKLKHMTEDKLHYRARGPLDNMCRQPTAGMQKEGGLRFGEMERDSAITHGGFQFLLERLLYVSDNYTMPCCNNCGQVVLKLQDPRPLPKSLKPKPRSKTSRRNERPPPRFYFKCGNCGTSRHGSVTFRLPYAAKLLFQELGSMNMKVILMSDEQENPHVQSSKPCEELSKNPVDYIKNLIDKNSDCM